MRQIREDIWNFLKSKGFRESERRGNILKKEISFMKTDPSLLKVVVKYKFGKNNLMKFHDGSKRFSILFKQITIKDGKITWI